MWRKESSSHIIRLLIIVTILGIAIIPIVFADVSESSVVISSDNNLTGSVNLQKITANNSTLTYQKIINGKLVEGRLIGPGLPPKSWVFNANPPNLNLSSTKTLDPEVPALIWSYGCAPTSASMYFGYYDRNGYPNIYTGPTNGGVFPITNAVWGSSSEGYGQCH